MRLENKTTEFKREYTDDLKYAVVALANTVVAGKFHSSHRTMIPIKSPILSQKCFQMVTNGDAPQIYKFTESICSAEWQRLAGILY